MIHARCISTELLLERQAPSLSHAERLRVETHLAECERCRREHVAMVGLLAIVEQKIDSSLKSNVQERAIARAVLRSREQHSAAAECPPAGVGLARAWSWGLGAALIATLLVVVGMSLRSRGIAPLGVARLEQTSGDRVVLGSLSVPGRQLQQGAAVPAHRELHPAGAFTVRLAHAKLSVRGAESMTWSPEDRVVSLRGGVADVSVDPARHQSFRVVTPRFSVNVIGTEFQVAADQVTVTRGRVQVSSPSGQPWAELGPGQSWSYVPPATGGELARQAPAVDPPAVPAAPAVNRGPSAPEVKSATSAAELLARARHRLAAGDARAALVDLDAVLSARGSRGQQAEAYTLKADCALVQGDARSAVRQYLDVSRRFPGLRAAETALFAAARIEANGGNKASAKNLLLAYRERYPAGQFTSDVDARLRTLEAR